MDVMGTYFLGVEIFLEVYDIEDDGFNGTAVYRLIDHGRKGRLCRSDLHLAHDGRPYFRTRRGRIYVEDIVRPDGSGLMERRQTLWTK